MPKHARAIIAAARAELQETNSADPLGNLWTDPEILGWANEGTQQVVPEILDLDEDFFGDYFDITTAALVAIYDLPSRFIRMRQVEYILGTTRVDVPERRASPGNPPFLSGVSEPSAAPPFAYALFNDQIHFDPPPSGVMASAFRCWYVGTPPDLTYGTASAGGASTITLQAADDTVAPWGLGASGDDDYYNRTWIVITSGTGAGQRRRISDYVGDTKVATVSPAWSVQPTNASLYATETILPEPLWRLPQLFAAICGKGKYKQDARQLTARFNALHESISSLERRTSTERGVEPFDPGDGL